MAGYLNQNGNSIGSLLRFIQEQKSQSPMVPPATEVGSPIRDVVQEPLKAPESIGTSRQVSIKPEAALGQTGETTPAITPSGEIVPTGPSVSVPAGITPTLQRATAAIPQSMGSSIQKTGESTSISTPSVEKKISAGPSIATSITPQRTTVGGTILFPSPNVEVKRGTPAPEPVPTRAPAGYVAPSPTPTPAPQYVPIQQKQNSVGQVTKVGNVVNDRIGTVLTGSIGQAWRKLFGR